MRFFLVLWTLAITPWLVQGAPRGNSLESRQSSTYWLPQISQGGTIAYASNSPLQVPNDYKVFRNVKDYGALGDGTTDDFIAINQTLFDGGRCGINCNSSTVLPALVYFPPGTYVVSQPIVMPYYTQMVGDAINIPTIKGSAAFEGIALVDSNPYYPGISNPDGSGINWYRNQNNFFRQLRNFIIDLTNMPETNNGGASGPAGLHWQVAQATSLQNIQFNMKPKSDTNKQQGIYMENGSGGFMADLTFNGGGLGMSVGNQQFTTRNLTFNGCKTAISVQWDWLWTFKSININNADIGIDMSNLQDGSTQTVGSIILFDSSITNTVAGIKTSHNATSQPSTGGTLTIQNVNFQGTTNAVVGADGVTPVLPGGSVIDMFIQGDAYLPARNGPSRFVRRQAEPMNDCDNSTATTVHPIPPISTGSSTSSLSNPIGTSSSSPAGSSVPGFNSTVPTAANQTFGTCAPAPQATKLQQIWDRPRIASSLLDSTGAVFQRSKPQYQNEPASAFVSVKTSGAVGDGLTDDSDAIQRALNSAASNHIVYFPHGAYKISKTIQVPSTIRITGEIWPLIMIDGTSSVFNNVDNPQPAFRVGNPGDQGMVEITDLMFETRGPAPGAIMMEWNVKDPQGQQGVCGMWDVHFRVGGSAGTELQTTQCRGSTPDSKAFNPQCYGSFLMMHVTQQASGYFENCWFWVADHELDLPGEDKLNVFNGRGVLVQSQGPVWMYGTSSEHHVLYNYQVSEAQNVFMGFIQTETAYMQSAPNSLTSGFTPNQAYSDPTFADCTTDTCKKTWGLRVVDSQNVYVMGAGLYSFFEDYSQTCLATSDCQLNMVDLQCSSEVYLFGLTTKASVNMINVNNQPVAIGADHVNGFGDTLALFHLG
jgi:glucan 1,3-beta-glucosidase